jgi:hypothetical protein
MLLLPQEHYLVGILWTLIPKDSSLPWLGGNKLWNISRVSIGQILSGKVRTGQQRLKCNGIWTTGAQVVKRACAYGG